jgi:hypothetical protein
MTSSFLVIGCAIKWMRAKAASGSIPTIYPQILQESGKEDMHKSSASPVLGGLNVNFMYIPGNIFFYCLNCANKRGLPKDDLIFIMMKTQPGAAGP